MRPAAHFSRVWVGLGAGLGECRILAPTGVETLTNLEIFRFPPPPPQKAHYRVQNSHYCFFHKDFIFMVYFFQVFRQRLCVHFLRSRCFLRAPHVSTPPSMFDHSNNIRCSAQLVTAPNYTLFSPFLFLPRPRPQ